MSKIDGILEEMERNAGGVRFKDVAKVCEHYFGKPRNKASSHHIYRTPWPGDPRVNIQEGKAGKAKAYQVKQVLMAIEKVKGNNNG